MRNKLHRLKYRLHMAWLILTRPSIINSMATLTEEDRRWGSCAWCAEPWPKHDDARKKCPHAEFHRAFRNLGLLP